MLSVKGRGKRIKRAGKGVCGLGGNINMAETGPRWPLLGFFCITHPHPTSPPSVDGKSHPLKDRLKERGEKGQIKVMLVREKKYNSTQERYKIKGQTKEEEKDAEK